MVNVTPVQSGKTKRFNFGKIKEYMEMPNLLDIQKSSYKWFITKGLQEVLDDMGEITEPSGNLMMRFTGFNIDFDDIKYDVKECKDRGTTYSAKMTLKANLYDSQTGEFKEEAQIKMGDSFPVMTDSGTFIINGAERCIVSQLVRSPGVYYDMTTGLTENEKMYSATVIPARGAWLEYDTDKNGVFNVCIDKNKKIPVTTFIRALGLSSNQEILEFFGPDDRIFATLEKDSTVNKEEALLEIYKKMKPGEPPTLDTAQTLIDNFFFDERRYEMSRVGRYKYNKKLSFIDRLPGFKAAENVVTDDGEVICMAGEVITKDIAREIEQSGITQVYVNTELSSEKIKVISNGMADIKPFLPQFTKEQLESKGINEKVRYAVLKTLLEEIEKDNLNDEEILSKLEANKNMLIPKHIVIDDIFASINYLNTLACGVGTVDDIDHLGNRRIRCVGELLQNQFKIGFSRMEKTIKERMMLHAQEPEKVTAASLVNTRQVTSVIREFFGSSQLSQFMDQNNPLAELTHKRRLSALGPGGLSRERASFEVRDVHYSHYGRMCPIETPEGQNIGLISYLSTFARINEYGFIEAPFRPIDKETGEVLPTFVYMTADVEDNYTVVQGNEPLDENNRFIRKKVNARHRDEFLEIDPSQADYMDVSPKMVVSVATSLIPFLENDDANRALMGANMQRQAVPLLKCDSPIVGTGMEHKAATDSGVCVVAARDGKCSYVSADKIVITAEDGTHDTYNLIKFMRSNQGTCIDQKPIVDVGEEIKAGQVIADGPATHNGELALGKNALIGFMTWEGYNYEDAVLINEKLVRDDVYTSIHIEKYELEARDTKLGPEEITRDIPNVGENATRDLDENGVIRVGAEVRSGDILVGKVTPKGETELTPEERLLRAIFGDKAREFRDTSLRLDHGEYGFVVKVDTYTRETNKELSPGVNKMVKVYVAQKRKIQVGDKMAGRHGNKGVVSRVLPQEDMPFLEDGTPLDIVLNPLGVPSRMNIGQVLEVHLGFACKKLGEKMGESMKIMTPVFDGAHESDIVEALKEAGIREDGKSILIDGRTGKKFDNPITVGVMYFLKLHHLVDDKMHARSTGPYSLVTQQPLGGKAQLGGQRLGEMEVWALEAYGAAYTLQEMLTVKSDDVVGRVKTYEAIARGNTIPAPGVPEAFRVLVKELQSLALDIRVIDKEGNEVDLKQDINENTNFNRIGSGSGKPRKERDSDDEPEDIYEGLLDDMTEVADAAEEDGFLDINDLSPLDQ